MAVQHLAAAWHLAFVGLLRSMDLGATGLDDVPGLPSLLGISTAGHWAFLCGVVYLTIGALVPRHSVKAARRSCS